MSNSVTFTSESGMIRVDTTCDFGSECVVTISTLISNQNLTVLELQAQACEKSSQHLQKWADSLRLRVATESQ